MIPLPVLFGEQTMTKPQNEATKLWISIFNCSLRPESPNQSSYTPVWQYPEIETFESKSTFDVELALDSVRLDKLSLVRSSKGSNKIGGRY